MSALGFWLALVAFLAYARSPQSVTSAATPTPSAVSEDVFGGVAESGAVPVSLHIENHGAQDDRLLGAETPVANRVEVHQTRLEHGQREMQMIPEGIAIPAGKSLVLEAGAAHLMLVGLNEGLVQGRTFPLTLRFARAGEVAVTVRVRRKVDAGVAELPAVSNGDLTIALASAPPASPAHS